MTTLDASTEPVPFGDLLVHWDRRVLQPRLWTTAQSYWAAALSAQSPAGPILELFCGAGQIGLLAASLTGRSLVQVDQDPVAASFARRNAAAAGLTSDVRVGSVADALGDDERFGLVIIDPPWVPTAQVAQFPDDPVLAIDGGSDGTEQVVLGLGVALRHLHPEGHAVVQVGNADQADVVPTLLSGLGGGRLPWKVLEVRDYLPGGVLVHIGPGAHPAP
jgi:methylase of polypeptide subunit release factors